jgi:hypothetical protein
MRKKEHNKRKGYNTKAKQKTLEIKNFYENADVARFYLFVLFFTWGRGPGKSL